MVGLINLSHVGGLCLAQQTLTTEGLKDLPLIWRTLSCAADFDHKGSQGSAPCKRTLSSAADFDHEGSQRSAPQRRTLSPAADFVHIRYLMILA
jgi:hypothetical protein